MQLKRLQAAVRFAISGAAALLVVPLVLGVGSAGSAGAATTGGNFIATGHDLDFHCVFGETPSCDYFKIVLQKVQNGSTLPILALDEGNQVSAAVSAAGLTTGVVTVSPTSAAFASTEFTSSGAKQYSAIIVASDETCGGCDNSRAAAEAINTRSADFTEYFNAGGGILALAGAENRDIYYNFVPLAGVSAAAVSPPFTVTPAGEALGLTEAMANCCATHNSFNPPSSPFVILETDSAGLAETIAVFNGAIGGGGFSPAPSPSASTSASASSSALASASASASATPTATPTATISPSASSSASPAATATTRPPTPKPSSTCKPGYGYGSTKFCHYGPPGQTKSPRPRR